MKPEIDLQDIETKELLCGGCTNKCSVLRFKFKNGNISYAGNKCEKIFFNKKTALIKGYNAFDKKNESVFAGANTLKATSKLKIGIPRVLNMYENFPFWQTLFRELGFEVVLSSETTIEQYQKGVGSVMSDNICFPAKVVHGHILSLVEKGVDRIFFPMIPKEEKEFDKSNNSFNCPVVSGYPEVIQSSINTEKYFGIPLDKPIMTLSDKKVLKKQCRDYIEKILI